MKKKISNYACKIFALVCLPIYSNVASACAVEPYISSICVMSMSMGRSMNSAGYMLAAGQSLPVNQYQALYSLIGNTYGGTANKDFNLPDLRGRVALGAGAFNSLTPVYPAGQKGGAISAAITAAQLPVHSHTLTTGVGGVTVAATAGTLAVSTSLATVSGTANGSSLTLNSAGSSTGNATTPGGNAIAGSDTGDNLFSTNLSPTVPMKSGSIGGTLAVTLSGSPSNTVSGAPSINISGQTGVSGSSAAQISTMTPYNSMWYYIAVQGYYPQFD